MAGPDSMLAPAGAAGFSLPKGDNAEDSVAAPSHQNRLPCITGYYSDEHRQLFDASIKSPAVLKGWAARADNISYTSTNGTGRSWSNVAIKLAQTN